MHARTRSCRSRESLCVEVGLLFNSSTRAWTLYNLTMRVKNRSAVIVFFCLQALALFVGITLLAVTLGADACDTPFIARLVTVVV